MKIFNNFSIIFLILQNSKGKRAFKKGENEAISAAISDVTFELFSRHQNDFDVMILGNITQHILDISEKIRIESKVKFLKTLKISCDLILNKIFLLLIESIEVLNEILLLDCFKNFNIISQAAMDLKFLIYIEKNFNENQLKVTQPNYLYGELLHFSYFILNSQKEIELKTFEWWTLKACGKTQFLTLNNFNKNHKKWKKNLKIEKKFKNFHNCTLKVHSAIIDINIMKSQQRYGMPLTRRYHKILDIIAAAEGEMSKIFGNQANYKVKMLKYFEYKKSDLSHFIEKWVPTNKEHMGMLFYEDTIGIMIPNPMYYSSYDKMVLPFDRETWTYAIIVFGIGLIVILFVNLMPRWFKDFIYGKNVDAAAFNMVGTFFGVGQPREPENFTGRLLLLNFILFCLILRTGYQGEDKINFF